MIEGNDVYYSLKLQSTGQRYSNISGKGLCWELRGALDLLQDKEWNTHGRYRMSLKRLGSKPQKVKEVQLNNIPCYGISTVSNQPS